MEPKRGIALIAAACNTALCDDRASVYLRQAVTAAGDHDISAAIQHAKSAVNASASYVDAIVVLADLLLCGGSQRGSAMGYFQQVLARDPANTLAAWYLAGEELRKGDVLVALGLLSAAAECRPVDSYVVVTLAWLLQMTGRAEEAVTLFENEGPRSGHKLLCSTLIRLLRSRAERNQRNAKPRTPLAPAPPSSVLDRLCELDALAHSLRRMEPARTRPSGTLVGADSAARRARLPIGLQKKPARCEWAPMTFLGGAGESDRPG